MEWYCVLALAVLMCSHSATACPPRCTCHFGSISLEVVCPDAGLSQYPSAGLPADTTSITIQYTNLSRVSAHDLKATPLLQELHLPGNSITTLPEDLLLGLHHLHSMDLTGNQLEKLPPRVFYHAPLLNLVLKDNLLHAASADWLPTNSNLTWIDLSGNRLRKIPSALLRNLTHLEFLHLSQNLLEELPVESLQSLHSLERLYLNKNKIQVLDDKVFQNNTNLTHLFLQRNMLESLPATIFHGLNQLQYLDLTENRLRFLSPGTLGLGIAWVELTLNPWHCDAKIESLWKRLKRESVQSIPTCASPEVLKDKAIVSLERKDLGLAD